MSRFALSPRAALVLVGVVVLVAIGVVWSGGGSDGAGSVGTGVTVVSGAPTVAAPGGGGRDGAGPAGAAPEPDVRASGLSLIHISE
ncbi:hypothetical protein, partial [Curtobacterium sp. MCBD17_032]|uniref:hypothetical protein n=1 Tax=Curtobacterium sp. MCBD17_032 TaxID=2175659 RepID=UPI000DB647FA